MENARSEASPLGERFSLDAIINGIAHDLDALRAGRISVDDARVRAELAKQFMNGVRLVVNAQKFLHQRAIPVTSADSSPLARGDKT